MATGQLQLGQIKLGDNVDTSKNFIIKTPAIADGTLKIQRENGTDVLSIDANGKVTTPGNVVPAFSTVFTGTTVNPTITAEMTTNTKVFDTTNALSSVSGRFQPTIAGYYQLNATLSWGGAASSGVSVQIAVNGVIKADSASSTSDTGPWKRVSVGTLVYLNGTTDFASVQAYEATTAATVTGYYSGFLARAA